MFGPEKDEVTGDWKRLRNEKLHDLHSSQNSIWVNESRRMRWDGHVARVGDRTCAYRSLVREPEGKRPLGRHRRRCEDKTKMDLQEIG